MSSLIVEVCAVEEIAPHPNADRIERVRVKNWWCIASKGHYKVGDKAVYVPTPVHQRPTKRSKVISLHHDSYSCDKPLQRIITRKSS